MKSLRLIFVAIILTLFGSGANADYEAGVNPAFNGDFDTAFLEFSGFLVSATWRRVMSSSEGAK